MSKCKAVLDSKKVTSIEVKKKGEKATEVPKKVAAAQKP